MKTLALDLDGVVHSYKSGWRGASALPDPPTEGAFAFILRLLDTGNWEVVMHSSRFARPEEPGLIATMFWFLDHGFPANRLDVSELDNDGSDSTHSRLTEKYPTVGTSSRALLKFSATKPGAFVSLDDRALTFTGRWPTPEELESFQTWTQRQLHTVDPVERLLRAFSNAKMENGELLGMDVTDLGHLGTVLCTPRGLLVAEQILRELGAL